MMGESGHTIFLVQEVLARPPIRRNMEEVTFFFLQSESSCWIYRDLYSGKLT